MQVAKFAALLALTTAISLNTKDAFANPGNAILIEFTSKHCGHCTTMRPIVDRMQASGTAVRRVDVNQEPGLVRRYSVDQTPTYLVLRDGKEVARLVGTHTADQLHEALNTPSGGVLTQTNSQQRHVDPMDEFQASFENAPKTRLAPTGNLAGDPDRRLSGISRTRTISPGLRDGISDSRNGPPSAADSQSQPNTFGPTPVPANAEVMPSLIAADAIQRARAATVRLRVFDGHGHGVGTGTVIDAHGDEALVMTCGHLFRDTDGQGRIEVDVFFAGQTKTVPGQLIDYEAKDYDIAVVAIRPGFEIAPVVVVPTGMTPRVGEAAFSFGCDRGADPSRRDTRITGVNKYNQHIKMSNLEIDGAPIDGRSGGGLFDTQGRLIGVCNAADYEDNVGLYTGPGSIAWQLERVNLSTLMTPSTTKDPGKRVPAARVASLQHEPEIALASATGEAFPHTSTPGIPHADQEVIVIIRNRSEPQRSEVMTIDRPSEDLLRQLRSRPR